MLATANTSKGLIELVCLLNGKRMTMRDLSEITGHSKLYVCKQVHEALANILKPKQTA